MSRSFYTAVSLFDPSQTSTSLSTKRSLNLGATSQVEDFVADLDNFVNYF